MGLTDTLYHRRPAMDYLFQSNQLIGAFRFNRSLQQLPVVDEYEKDGKFIYAVWVPDEKGTTLPCSISLPNVDSAIIYRLVIGSDEPSAETVPVVDGTVQLTATETPIFIMAKPTPPNKLYVLIRDEKIRWETLVNTKKP